MKRHLFKFKEIETCFKLETEYEQVWMEEPYEEIISVSDKDIMFSLPTHVRVSKFVSLPFYVTLCSLKLSLYLDQHNDMSC